MKMFISLGFVHRPHHFYFYFASTDAFCAVKFPCYGGFLFIGCLFVKLLLFFNNKSPSGTCHLELVFVMLIVQGKTHTKFNL